MPKKKVLPVDISDWFQSQNDQNWKCLGVSSMSEFVMAAQRASVAAVCYAPGSNVICGALVGNRWNPGHDDCVVRVTAIVTSRMHKVIPVLRQLVQRLRQSETLRGIECQVTREDASRFFSRLRFVEADIREERYDCAKLCYSPVYRHTESETRGLVRMSFIWYF